MPTAYQRGYKEAMVKLAKLSWADLMAILPGGSLIEGATNPAEGASRAETMALGGGGGLLGAIAGGALAGKLTNVTEQNPFEPDKQTWNMSLPAVLGGAAVGSVGGNILGRWLAERPTEDNELAKIMATLEELKSKSQDSNVNITVAPSGRSKV